MVTRPVLKHYNELDVVLLYNQGFSTAEVAERYGISSSTVRRVLQRHNVPLRKGWSPVGGVTDGYKWCSMCKKNLPVSDFYARSSGHPYSYCKPCDRRRSVETGRKSRLVKRNQQKRVVEERRLPHAKSRLLLADVVKFFNYRYPDLELATEIKAHLALSKKLFGDTET